MKTPSADRIEALESRIAPAKLVGNILTYTDIDGDAVKVTFTHAKMLQGDFDFGAGGFLPGDTTTPQALGTVSLAGKTGGGFTLTAAPKGGKGDGHANIHQIAGFDTDLGTISVDGNVELISAGKGVAGTVGLKSFTALSLGLPTLSSTTTVGGLKNVGSFTVKGDITNNVYVFTGGVKSLSVGGNIVEIAGAVFGQAGLNITGDVGTLKIGGSLLGRGGSVPNLEIDGKVGVLSIGGSVVGGRNDLNSLHQIEISGPVKTLAIGGDLVGGAGYGTGAIAIGDDVTSAKIGGSMRGGAGEYSGSLILSGKLKSFALGDSIIGGSGLSSGFLNAFTGAGVVKIGGSIVGGTNSFSGLFLVNADVASIAIGHNLQASDNSRNTPEYEEGSIVAWGKIGSVSIGGDFISGRDLAGGGMTSSGMISAEGAIGTVKIGGSVLGDPGHLAYIMAGARDTKGALKAIGSLTVKGNVESASLLAGYGYPGSRSGFVRYNQDSGIGAISIGGNLTGSFITAGSSAGTDSTPGTRDDLIDVSDAVIDSLKIGGTLTGLDGAGHTFYIQSSIINKVTIGKATYTHAQIKGAPGNVLEFNAIGDVVIASPH